MKSGTNKKPMIHKKTNTKEKKTGRKKIPTTWLLHWEGANTKSDPENGRTWVSKPFPSTKLGLYDGFICVRNSIRDKKLRSANSRNSNRKGYESWEEERSKPEERGHSRSRRWRCGRRGEKEHRRRNQSRRRSTWTRSFPSLLSLRAACLLLSSGKQGRGVKEGIADARETFQRVLKGFNLTHLQFISAFFLLMGFLNLDPFILYLIRAGGFLK